MTTHTRKNGPPRGYFGIGVYRPKSEMNIGTLWRHAVLYGASYIFTIGARYGPQSTDTVNAWEKIPLLHYEDHDDFMAHLPRSAEVVCVELGPETVELPKFSHPKVAVYLLGAEDRGLPQEVMAGRRCVQIPALEPWSMNVSVAGTMVIYDRYIKGRRVA